MMMDSSETRAKDVEREEDAKGWCNLSSYPRESTSFRLNVDKRK